MAQINSVWMVDPNTFKLIPPFQLNPQEKPIKIAEAFTISLKSCIVFEDLDQGNRGDNDILIVSHQALGENQPTRQVHFFKKEIPEGTPIQNFLSEVIYTTEDYSGERLFLQFEVVEVDNDQSELEGIVNPLKNLVSVLGGAFPLLSFYGSFANVVINLFERVYKALDNDEQVMSVPFNFFPQDKIGRLEAPLQTGIYVIFARPIDAEGLQLESNGILSQVPNKVAYLTINIKSGLAASPKFVIGQKLETILSQLRFGQHGMSQGQTFNFLLETMTAYNNFKTLGRYQELLQKTSRTPEEQKRFEQLANNPDLKPFLPSS